MSFQDWSYKRHTNHEITHAQSELFPSAYTNSQSIDAWRHRRMQEIILPLIKFYPQSTWMTVGDGNFGSDAFFLRDMV